MVCRRAFRHRDRTQTRLYVAGSNDPALAADASRIVYVVSNIPAALATGNIGRVELARVGNDPRCRWRGAGHHACRPRSGRCRCSRWQHARASATDRRLRRQRCRSSVLAKSVVSVVDRSGGTTRAIGLDRHVSHRARQSIGSGIADKPRSQRPVAREHRLRRNSITVNGQARTDVVDADRPSFPPAR